MISYNFRYLIILIFITSIGFHLSSGSQKTIPIEPILEDLDFPEPYRLEVVAENLRSPSSMAFLPDGRILVTEKIGRVQIIENDSLLQEPALILPVTLTGTSGMSSIVAHPNFEDNSWVYIASTYDTGEDLWLEVNRFTMEGNKLKYPKRIIDEIPCNINHSGGRLRFGPDNKLYLTTGDINKPPLAQKLDNVIGKVLRINPDGSIPDDNPFVGVKGVRQEIYSYGHRNPQGLYFHPEDGSLWEAEHGNFNWDEFNRIYPKHNYGWPVIEGLKTKEGMEPPALSMMSEPAVAVSSCLIYSGKAFPSLKHHALLATLQGASLIRAHIKNGQVVKADRYFRMAFGRLREVAESPEGYIYFSTSFYDVRGQRKWDPLPESDRIIRIVPANTPPNRLQIIHENQERKRTVPMKFAADRTFETQVEQTMHKNCATCHGHLLQGGIQSSLVDGVWSVATSGTDDELFDIIHNGRPMVGMMGFRNTLKEHDIREVIRFIRSHESSKAKDTGPIIQTGIKP